jgi:hypothetical protein
METLTKKERMRRALSRQPVDRLPVQTNYTGAMGAKLAAHFGCSKKELDARLDNHLLRVDVSHTPRLSADAKVSFDCGGQGGGPRRKATGTPTRRWLRPLTWPLTPGRIRKRRR